MHAFRKDTVNGRRLRRPFICCFSLPRREADEPLLPGRSVDAICCIGVPESAPDVCSTGLDRLKHSMRLRRQLDSDWVAGSHVAAGKDDAHDARFSDEVAALVAPQGRFHQALLNPVQLGTGIAQPRHLDEGVLAQLELCAGRKPEQIDAAGGHVFAHLPGRDGEPGVSKLVVQLGVNQVYLAQVGLALVACHARAMLDRLA
jgi:hypothetical protein